VATSIRGAIILAKMSVIPVRRGYWGNKIGKVRARGLQWLHWLCQRAEQQQQQ
jgi:hypothetical protein